MGARSIAEATNYRDFLALFDDAFEGCRTKWNRYPAAILVIDSTVANPEIFKTIRDTLGKFREDARLKRSCLLFFINKVQCDESQHDPDSIVNALETFKLGGTYYLQATDAIANIGLFEGLDRLDSQLRAVIDPELSDF